MSQETVILTIEEIQRLAEEQDLLWPCFSAELRNKLNDFLGQIV